MARNPLIPVTFTTTNNGERIARGGPTLGE